MLSRDNRHRQFREYARQHYGEATFKYVTHPEDVRGFRNVRIVRTGTYWVNPMNQDDTVLMLEEAADA